MQFHLMIPGNAVKKLIIANLAIWLVLQLIVEKLFLGAPYITEYFGLRPDLVIERFFVWQFFTYILLHSMNPMHILFNMLTLWFLGSELEMRWGSRQFLTYYFVTGIGAGVIYIMGVVVAGLITGHAPAVYSVPVVGASGAVFGLLLAYAILFGDRMIYFFGAFPIQARYFVAIIGFIEVVTLLSVGFTGAVANLAHLGGIVVGFIYLMLWTRLNQFRWRKTGEARRNLRLVINKDKDDRDGGPRYWN
ncbi:MAG: rhomboid family intramembrane serine protease [Bdellovibrionaceae bacterium]|nr:rhomboid family intramembrane serine protease [Pseudobdellovibrionaceae bacterium]